VTGVLHSPVSTEIGLAAQRWEVETSVLVAVTGETAPGDADFVIESYATQSSLRSDLLKVAGNDLIRHLRDEFGMQDTMTILVSDGQVAVLMRADRHVRGRGSTGQAQLLRGLLAEFIEWGTGIQRTAQRDIIEGILEEFPVPTFGSPPSDLSTITQLLQGSPFIAAVGYGVWSESPGFVVLSAGTAMVVWFARPAANVLRRSVAERLARKLRTSYRPEDEK
jgi:hypothetical protein